MAYTSRRNQSESTCILQQNLLQKVYAHMAPSPYTRAATLLDQLQIYIRFDIFEHKMSIKLITALCFTQNLVFR